MKAKSLILLLISSAIVGFSKPSDHSLEFRLAQETENPNWDKTEFEGKAIWLKPTAEMNSTHVESAELVWSKTMQERFAELPPEKQALMKSKFPEVDISTNRQPQIGIRFTPEGAKLLTEVSTKFTGQNLAIVYRGKILTAPLLYEPIYIEHTRIIGVFTVSEVQEIVTGINNK